MRVAIEKIEGVTSATVSLNEGMTTVQFASSNSVSIEQIPDAIRSNGFTPKEPDVRVAGVLIHRGDTLALAVPGAQDVLLLREFPGASGQITALRALRPNERITFAGQVPVSEGLRQVPPGAVCSIVRRGRDRYGPVAPRHGASGWGRLSLSARLFTEGKIFRYCPGISRNHMSKAKRPSRATPAKPRLQDTVRLSAEGLAKVLGDLEARVMRVVWILGQPSTARSVHKQVIDDHDVALLTVITVLNKLVAKGLLKRAKREDVYHYEARLTESEFRALASQRVVSGILSLGPQAVAASLVDALAEHDPTQLTELGRLIRRKLKEQEGS